MTLDDPPLAAATFSRGFAGLGTRRKLNVRSTFSRSYLGSLQAEQAKAIAELREAIPQAVVSRRYQVLVNGFAVSVPYGRLPDLLDDEHRRARLPEPGVSPQPQPRAVRDRRACVLRPDRSEGRRREGGRGGRRCRPGARIPRPDRLLVPAGLPEGPRRRDVAQGDRRARLCRPGRKRSTARSRSVLSRDVRRRDHRRRTDRRSRPGRRGFCNEAEGGCHPAVAGVSGVAPRAYIGNYRVFNVTGPLGDCCSANSPGNRRRVRGRRTRRDGHHQLLGRWPSGRSAHGHPHRGRRERRSRRRRTDHLGGQRPRLLRARNCGIARDRSRCDQRRCGRQRARLRLLTVGRLSEWASTDALRPDGHDPGFLDLGESASRRCRGDPRCEPTALRCRARGIAPRGDRARQSRRLPVRREGLASARRRRQRHRDRREPSWRSDVRVHHRALGGNDLGSRRLADPLGGRRLRRRCHRPLLE